MIIIMAADTSNEFAAFDFFVTAEHMVDWLHPSRKLDQGQLRAAPILALVSHIANGAKHFTATAKRHRSVSSIEKDAYVAEGYVESGYFEEPIVVVLTPSEEKVFGCTRIEAVELASRVLEHWRNTLALEASYLDPANSTSVNNAEVDQAGRDDAGET